MENDLGIVDTSVAEPVEQQAAEPVAEQQAAPVESQPELQEDVKGDERTMPAWLKAMKVSDPAGFAEARKTFFGQRGWNERFPGGVKEADEMRAFLEERGGRDAILSSFEELTGKASELDSLNEAIAAGDPKIVSQIAEANPEGFAKLAPEVFSRWSQADPEGWERSMTGVMAATIAQSGLMDLFKEVAIAQRLGSTPEQMGNIVLPMMQEIEKWAKSFQDGQQPGTQRQQAPGKNAGVDKLTAERQELDQQKEQIFLQDVSGKANSFRDGLIERELTGYKSKDAEDRKDAIGLIKDDVLKRLQQDASYQKALSGHRAKRDGAAIQKLYESRVKAFLPEIAQKWGKKLLGGKQEAPPTPTPVARRPVTPGAITSNKPRDVFDEIYSRA